MSEVGVGDAARNNAAWCDAVCSAHGARGEFFDSHWRTRAPAPRFYPDLVTLTPELAPVLAGVRELDRARPAESWAVKDSFAVLPLEQAGCRILFDAEWIVRSAGVAPIRRASQRIRWVRVRSEPELSAWETAWGESVGQARIFLPSLLARSEIEILAAHGDDDVIAAGVIANRTENVVGLSNLFVRGRDRAALRAECVEAAANAFPGLPLLGYETGSDLEASHALGFSSLGALRVWIRDA